MEGASSYVGICIGGHREELWRFVDRLKDDKKQLNVSRVDNSRVPGLYSVNMGTMRFIRPKAGLVGCVFCLILLCTCSWPQTDKVYLFLAAAL